MITNILKQTTLANNIITANNPLTRMKGLLGRSSISQGEALVIVPCQSVHMLFMKFAIDVVFIDRQNKVVGLCENLKPFQFSPIFFKSACAIELPTGTIRASKTDIGDLIRF